MSIDFGCSIIYVLVCETIEIFIQPHVKKIQVFLCEVTAKNK